MQFIQESTFYRQLHQLFATEFLSLPESDTETAITTLARIITALQNNPSQLHPCYKKNPTASLYTLQIGNEEFESRCKIYLSENKVFVVSNRADFCLCKTRANSRGKNKVLACVNITCEKKAVTKRCSTEEALEIYKKIHHDKPEGLIAIQGIVSYKKQSQICHKIFEDRYTGDISSFPNPTYQDLTKCAISVLKGIIYLHDNGWNHNDIRINNILFEKTDSDIDFRLGDFDLATKCSNKSFRAFKYQIPPEIFTTDDYRDIFSLGAALLIYFIKNNDYLLTSDFMVTEDTENIDFNRNFSTISEAEKQNTPIILFKIYHSFAEPLLNKIFTNFSGQTRPFDLLKDYEDYFDRLCKKVYEKDGDNRSEILLLVIKKMLHPNYEKRITPENAFSTLSISLAY